MNALGNTLFFCHFWLGDSIDKAFDVFNYDIAVDECGAFSWIKNYCIWLVQSDGFYFSNQYPPNASYLFHPLYL